MMDVLTKSGTSFITATHLHKLTLLPTIQNLVDDNKLLVKHLKITLDEDSKDLSFPIVDTINNNKYFNENNYYRFENEFIYTTEKEQLFKLDSDYEIYEFNKYS